MPCDPRTLTRAAHNLAEKQPEFALEAGLLALYWLAQGYGYEITSDDVQAAHDATMEAAEMLGIADRTRARIREVVATEKFSERFVTKVLRRQLGSS